MTLTGLFMFMHLHPQSAAEKRTTDIIARNRIKNQISWDYAYSDNKPGKNGIKTSMTLYSVTGSVALVTAYNPKGQEVNIEKYKYDDHGNKTEYARYSGNTSSKAAYQKTSKYNSMNLVVEETGYDGVENFINSYQYNSEGEMTEIRYLKNGILSEKRIFNRNGNTTSVSIYNTSGTMTSKLILRYDARKNLIEEVVYGVNQSELEKKTYNYDENRNLKEEAKFKLDKITLKTTYNYSTSGDLLDISEEYPGTPRFIRKSFTYDSDGNLTQINWRRKGNEEFNRISYTYDAKGLCTSADTWYPATKYRVLTRYNYEVY
jgi:hypothetical protein